jgi:hypothetical protein
MTSKFYIGFIFLFTIVTILLVLKTKDYQLFQALSICCLFDDLSTKRKFKANILYYIAILIFTAFIYVVANVYDELYYSFMCFIPVIELKARIIKEFRKD